MSRTTPSQFAKAYFRDRHGKPWEPRAYQAESMDAESQRKIICAGRDVGKTTEIEIMATWALRHCPGQEMLIATQTENQLDPLMQRIQRRIESTPDLRAHLVEARRSPSWFFRFDNNAIVWGRIAGPRGTNFQGMHVDFQIIDEAQEMTETAWGEIFQALNGGGIRWIYGVPNGLRNTFYRFTQPGSGYDFQHWPSNINPEFDPAKAAELSRLYGGPNSPGYAHRVMGLHGEPAHAVFSLEDYLACVDEALDFHHAKLHGVDPLPLPETASKGNYYLGCDLGYARDPSEFVVYKDAPPHLINVARIHLSGVNYARQALLINELDALYDFRTIAIDAGNNGNAVAHQLMQQGPNWCEKVRAIQFGAHIDTAPLPDGSVPRRRAKEFMTELITRRLSERTLVLPRLPDREAQYASHTYTVNNFGHILYEKGNDHIIDADRCALLGHYLHTVEPSTPTKSKYTYIDTPIFTFGRDPWD